MSSLSACEFEDGAGESDPISTSTTTVTGADDDTGSTDETGGTPSDSGEPSPRRCCLPDASCALLLGAECTEAGGEPDQSFSCLAPCPTPVGACCDQNSCSQTQRSECNADFSEESSCADACPDAPLGTCCFPEGCAVAEAEAECDQLNGAWTEGRATCEELCPGDAGGIEPGLYDVPPTVTAIEAALLVQPGFAMTEEDQRPVIVAGNGLVFIDLLTHEPIHEETLSSLFGAVAFTAHQDFLVTHGSAGSVLCEWSETDGTWAFCAPNAGNYTDATLVGSGPSGDAWLEAAFSFGEVFVNRFAADNSLGDSTSVSSAAVAAVSANTVISAYAADRDGPALMVTNGAPGQFLLHDLVDPNAPATLIGDVGNEPRRIRCLEPLCVISNLDGNLHRATWGFDSAPPVLVPGAVPVGVGPIGIDLIESGDNLAVVSTAFNDNTFSITEFDPAGAVVSNEAMPVPDGCLNPGHAIWVPDGDSPKVLVTCSGSDNYAVLDPR